MIIEIYLSDFKKINKGFLIRRVKYYQRLYNKKYRDLDIKDNDELLNNFHYETLKELYFWRKVLSQKNKGTNDLDNVILGLLLSLLKELKHKDKITFNSKNVYLRVNLIFKNTKIKSSFELLIRTIKTIQINKTYLSSNSLKLWLLGFEMANHKNLKNRMSIKHNNLLLIYEKDLNKIIFIDKWFLKRE